jgi:hypothetical protein
MRLPSGGRCEGPIPFRPDGARHLAAIAPGRLRDHPIHGPGGCPITAQTRSNRLSNIRCSCSPTSNSASMYSASQVDGPAAEMRAFRRAVPLTHPCEVFTGLRGLTESLQLPFDGSSVQGRAGFVPPHHRVFAGTKCGAEHLGGSAVIAERRQTPNPRLKAPGGTNVRHSPTAADYVHPGPGRRSKPTAYQRGW